jgi:hypothetical protein
MARATGYSRVFVAARSGNDANACNNVATPCQTFAGAIAQVSAGGEIIVVETGVIGVYVGLATVLGTSPGTNVVSGNGTDISGSLGTAITLQ